MFIITPSYHYLKNSLQKLHTEKTLGLDTRHWWSLRPLGVIVGKSEFNFQCVFPFSGVNTWNSKVHGVGVVKSSFTQFPAFERVYMYWFAPGGSTNWNVMQGGCLCKASSSAYIKIIIFSFNIITAKSTHIKSHFICLHSFVSASVQKDSWQCFLTPGWFECPFFGELSCLNMHVPPVHVKNQFICFYLKASEFKLLSKSHIHVWF